MSPRLKSQKKKDLQGRKVEGWIVSISWMKKFLVLQTLHEHVANNMRIHLDVDQLLVLQVFKKISIQY